MRLYLPNLGPCDVDKGAVLTPGTDAGTRDRIPIVAYLIETDDGRRILVDTGMHRKHIDDPAAAHAPSTTDPGTAGKRRSDRDAQQADVPSFPRGDGSRGQ